MHATDLVVDLILVFFALGMAAWAMLRWRSAVRELESARQLTADAGQRNESARRQANAALMIGSQLLAANDEQKVVEAAMQIGCEIFSAVGCSFVPYDEWGRSLPPLSRGHVPQPALNHWNERLGAPATRSICKACRTRQGSGENCPLLHGSQDGYQVHCFPLHSNGRDVGVVNFYLNCEGVIGEREQQFFSEIVSVVDRAFDMLRRRDQEVAALRYLQTAQARNDLPSSIKHLAAEIQKAMDVDVAVIWIRDTVAGLNHPLVRESCRDLQPAPAMAADTSLLQGIWQSVSASDAPISLEKMTANSSWRTLLAVPLRWGDEKPLGMLILANTTAQTFTQRQSLLLQTLAGETALLIKNVQLVVQVEYQAVVEERSRLAREIHDGLAQTLAFLKIEATRMKNYATQGEYVRLQDILDGCYRTISDAYLDARLAIDNLRCAPGDDFTAWVQQTAIDFGAEQGLSMDLSQVESGLNLPPHIQAQVMRVVQEAFSNIRKHAQAASVCLKMMERDREFILEISDDGVGFPHDMTQPNSHYGLRGMRERAAILGARFSVDSQPGTGTTISLRLSLDQEEAL